MAGFAPQCTFSLIKQQQSHNSLNETGTNLYGTQDSFFHTSALLLGTLGTFYTSEQVCVYVFARVCHFQS